MSSNTTLLREYNTTLRLYLIPSMVLVALIFVMGSVGNAFVLHNYYHHIKRTSHWYLVVCLTMYDLFICVVIMPLEMSQLFMGVMYPNEVFCRVQFLLTNSALVGSLWILICIAAHTYMKICRSFYYIKEHYIKIVCFTSLVFTLPVHIPIAFMTFGAALRKTTTPGQLVYTCGVTAAAQGTLVENVYRCFLILFLVVAIVSFSVSYKLVIRRIRQQAELICTNLYSSRTPSPQALEMDQKTEASISDDKTFVDNISQLITLPDPKTLLEPENVLQPDRISIISISFGKTGKSSTVVFSHIDPVILSADLIDSNMIQPLRPKTSQEMFMPASCISTEEPAVGEKDGSVNDDQKKVSHDPSSLQITTQNSDTSCVVLKEGFSRNLSSGLQTSTQNSDTPCADPKEGFNSNITSGLQISTQNSDISCVDPKEGFNSNITSGLQTATQNSDASCVDPKEFYTSNLSSGLQTAIQNSDASCVDPKEFYSSNLSSDLQTTTQNSDASCVDPKEFYSSNLSSGLQTAIQNSDVSCVDPKEGFSSNITSEVCGEKTEAVEQIAQPPLQPTEGVSGLITSGEEAGFVHMQIASEALNAVKNQSDAIISVKDKSSASSSHKAHICTPQTNLPSCSLPRNKSTIFARSLSVCKGNISSQMSHLSLPVWINFSPEGPTHDVGSAENTPDEVCDTSTLAVNQPVSEDSNGKMLYGPPLPVDVLPVISISDAVDSSVTTQQSYAGNKDDTKCESSAVTGTMHAVYTEATANLLADFSLEQNSFSSQGQESSFHRQAVSEQYKKRFAYIDNTSFSLTVISCTFILCYAPFLLLLIFNVEAKRHEMGLTIVGVYEFVLKFTFVRNAIHPVFYFIFNKKYKDIVREQFSKVCTLCSCSQ